MPGPVQDDDGHVVGRLLLRPRHPADVLAHRQPDVDDVGRLGTGHELLHVEHRRRVEHRAARRHRHDRQRVAHAQGGEPGAVDRVDGDVALRPPAVADPLAVEQHRRFVLLALTDDHDAAHAHRVDQGAHRVDRGAIGAVLVAATDPAAGRHGGGLGHAHELHRQVAVGRLAGRGQGGRERVFSVGSVMPGSSLVRFVAPDRIVVMARPAACAHTWLTPVGAMPSVGEDGRVTETPTAPEESAAPAKQARGRESVGDMVRSMSLVLVVVAVVFLLTLRDEPHQTVHRVDYSEQLQEARQVAPYDVLAPVGLGGRWKATSARNDNEVRR